MKIIKKNNKLILYIPKIDLENSLDKIEKLEIYFTKLFLKLNNIYKIKINGYYNITVYNNEIYGTIVELVQEKLKYQKYLSDKIDMNIDIIDNSDFIYKIDDYYKSNKIITFKINSDIYIKPINIDNNDLSILMEHSNIIYGNELDKIKYKLKKI